MKSVMIRSTLLLIAILLIASPVHAQSDLVAAEKTLAVRFGTLASSALQGQEIQPIQWRQNALMLEAAHRLDPNEPRYIRLLIESYRQSGRYKDAANAAIKLATLEKGNIAAQILTIDFSLATLESIDAQLTYLQKVLDANWPDATRSHAATLIANLQIERAQPQEALRTLRRAVELNPVNPQANRLLVNLAAPTATDLERARLYMQLVRATPRDINAVAALGDALADLGMGDIAIQAYDYAVLLSQVSNVPVTPQLATQIAAAHFVVNDGQAAALLDQILEAQPENISARFLQALVYLGNPQSPQAQKARLGARIAMVNLLNRARAFDGAAPEPIPFDSTTLPPIPDLSNDHSSFEQATPEQRDAFIRAVTDLAWMELYASGPSSPETQRLIETLRAILPADSLTLARIEGWNFLLQGKPDEARVKLSAIADRDPLSELGLLRLANRDDQVIQRGARLLSENPTGLAGAFIAYDMRKLGLRLEQKPEAREILSPASRLLRDLPQMVRQPQTFYLLRAEPLQIAHEFGEPMLARITLQNVSDYDLSIDPQGAIQPDLWFDARIKGIHQQSLSGIAFDRLIQNVVLKSQQSVSQVVRLDQGKLRALLESNPAAGIPISFYVTTNPSSRPDGEGAIPGSLGQFVECRRMMERVAFSLNAEGVRERLITDLRTGTPALKLRRLDLVYAYIRTLMGQQNPPETNQQIARELAIRINQGRDETTAPVAAWAGFLSGTLVPPEQRVDLARLMRLDRTWYTRMLSLAMLAADADAQQAAAEALRNDPEALVAEYAKLILDNPPTTQPTTTEAAD